MLLEFEIENDGAFAETSRFSLIASSLKDCSQDAIREVNDIAKTRSLTSTLILGKNGSGKSTLIAALNFIPHFVRDSALDIRTTAKLPYDPNVLATGCSERPTRYMVIFSVNSNVYQFEFSYNQSRVLTESLSIADKSTRFRKLYVREWLNDEESYDYSFGEALTGAKHTWQKSTRDNALYISTAAQLNSDILREPYRWLSDFVRSTRVGAEFDDQTTQSCFDSEEVSNRVAQFLRAMDINVEGFDISKESVDQTFLEQTFAPEFLNKIFENEQARVASRTRLSVKFKKKSSDGSIISMPIIDESTGTRALFRLAGPLFDALDNGYCLIVDEINTSLHPKVVHYLVSLFSNPSINKKRAQLIFTSHDVSVLRDGFLRRDQVWFIENDGIQASIVPLSDYSPRKGEALEKGYLAGRYGGVPVLLPNLFGSTHG